jgi:exonuclease III
MRILAWNCRGLGNSAAVLALLDVKRRNSPEVVFLSETHLDRYSAECLGRRLSMDFSIIQPSDCRKGGVIMFSRKRGEYYSDFCLSKLH